MQQTDDRVLLWQFAEDHSDEAFAALVTRHANLVYSVALRQVGDPHHAEEITQAVFITLSRKAAQLRHDKALSSWLFQAARLTAINFGRSETRRHHREQEAHMQSVLNESGNDLWHSIAPLLDTAVASLGEKDRRAIVLRFYEGRKLREVGAALGASEDAAEKRVERALQKLRTFFVKRGVASTTASIAAAVAANSVQAAPAGLAATITSTALASAATGTTTVLTILRLMSMTKFQLGVTAVVLAGTATTLIVQHQSQTGLVEEKRTLRQQIAQVESDNAGLSDRVVRVSAASSLRTDQLRELLKLRGEVGMLRRQQRELEQATTASKLRASGVAGLPPSGVTAQPNRPAPLQLQLVVDDAGESSETITNNAGGNGGEVLHVQKAPLLDYTALSSATVTKSEASGAPHIEIEFNPEGKELLAAITKENLNKRLAFVLDGHLYSAPVIRSEITDGKAQITGNFTEEEAGALAAKINAAINGK